MELHYFGVLGRGFQIRMVLDYCGVDYKNQVLDFPTFGANKAAGKYKYGQVPMLVNNGNNLYQSGAIMRYIAKTHKGKNGEELYPNDPTMMWKIDARTTTNDDFFDSYANFSIPIVPGYKDKDEHFIAYITKKWPDYL